ncbi:MAG: aldolase/citrate lyase family protein [Chloroflexi bacterium]|nr:aldolase/citrate lyase family protein [Chloroflexota bacterium]
MTIIPPNRMKSLLRSGKSVAGTMLAEFQQPSVMQALKNAGYDFATIDMEHGVFDYESVADLSRFGRHIGITPLVRAPDKQYPYIARALDVGAQGIMVPRLRSAEDVREVVNVVKYPPFGERGCSFNRGHTDFHGGPLLENMRAANEETLLIVQVETRGALDAIEEIASITGVDVLLIGPTDLSIDLGVAGQLDAPPLIEAINLTLAVCEKHGVAPGIQITNLEWLIHWAERGMRVLSSFSEVALLQRGGISVTQKLARFR